MCGGVMNISKTYLNAFTLIALSLFLFFPNIANANGETSENASHIETCKTMWDDLWPKAKEGDIEARFKILVLLAPPPDMSPLLFPGNSGDYASQYRDIIIWGIYSSDYFLESTDKNSLAKTYRKIILKYVAGLAHSRSSPVSSYLNCMNERKKGCDVQAIKDGLVPAFSDFVENVDNSLKAKKFGTCKKYFTDK